MKTNFNRPIKEGEGWSTRLADGQEDSTLAVGRLVKTIGLWSVGRLADREKEKAVTKEVCQKESMVEAGQLRLKMGQRVSFRKVFDSCESPILFLVVFIFRRK
jgi:hypothetical protein